MCVCARVSVRVSVRVDVCGGYVTVVVIVDFGTFFTKFFNLVGLQPVEGECVDLC